MDTRGSLIGGASFSKAESNEEGKGMADRSKKKVRLGGAQFSGEVSLKPRMEDWMEEEAEGEGKANYKDSLMKNRLPAWCDLDEEMVGKKTEVKTGFEDVEEPTKGIAVDMSDPLRPKFVLDDSEKERLVKPFRRTLVVKLLGATPNYDFLRRKFTQLWARAGQIRIFDLPNDFYLVKFESQDDYDIALTGGPWLVADSYLSVMRWRADFNPREEVVDRVIAWVRLSDLPATHYDKKFLFNLGNAIGRAIKVDIPTAQRGRGKFARLCVELDLTQPLIPEFCIDEKVFSIEYECMSLLCLHCGRVGHVKESCAEWLRLQKGREKSEVVTATMNKEEQGGHNDEVQEGESLWKTVQRPRRQRRNKVTGEDIKINNRFGVLDRERGRPLADITNQRKDQGGGVRRMVETMEKAREKADSTHIECSKKQGEGSLKGRNRGAVEMKATVVPWCRTQG